MTIAARPQIHIGSVIRNAAVFNFKRWTSNPMNSDLLPSAVDRLFVLLEQRNVEYVLVGGIAMLQYVEGRNTEDIDLIVTLPSLSSLPEIKITSQDLYFARGRFEALQIDFLLTQNPLFELVRRKYTTQQQFIEREIRCASVEGLLLLKLYALPSLYRQGSFARVGIYENDIAALLFTYQPPLEPLLNVLALYLGDTDLVSVREILADIQQRIARFGKNQE